MSCSETYRRSIMVRHVIVDRDEVQFRVALSRRGKPLPGSLLA